MKRSGVGSQSSNKQRRRRQSESQQDCQWYPSRLYTAFSSQIRVWLLLVWSFSEAMAHFHRRWLLSLWATTITYAISEKLNAFACFIIDVLMEYNVFPDLLKDPHPPKNENIMSLSPIIIIYTFADCCAQCVLMIWVDGERLSAWSDGLCLMDSGSTMTLTKLAVRETPQPH